MMTWPVLRFWDPWGPSLPKQDLMGFQELHRLVFNIMKHLSFRRKQTMVLQRAWLELQLFPTILVCVCVCSDTIYSFEATTHIKDDWPLDEYCRGCNECLFFGVFYTSQLMIIDLCLWCLRGTYCNPRVFYYPQPISHDSWGFFKQTVQRMLR